MPSTPTLVPSRLAYRGSTDPEEVRRILSKLTLCTISCQHDGQVYALPTAYVLHEDQLVIHGSVKSSFLSKVMDRPVCITVFSQQALVLAASAFHHSMNYESVVIYSRATEISEPARKESSLRAFTEKIIPGRWDLLRPVTAGELAATRVLAFPIHTASVKMRTGGPSDEKEDQDYPVWTGIVPVKSTYDTPVPEKTTVDFPEHLTALING